jgi:hypothetical protein
LVKLCPLKPGCAPAFTRDICLFAFQPPPNLRCGPGV